MRIRGTGTIDTGGYHRTWIFEIRKQVKTHRLVLEQNNIKIPDGCVVHHKNGNKLDNSIENLEILTMSEHHILHHNERARKECGDEKKRKCTLCHKYDFKENMRLHKAAKTYRHAECIKAYAKLIRKRKQLERA